MTDQGTSESATAALVEAIAADARPVHVLAPPLKRALSLLAILAVAGSLAIWFMADIRTLFQLYVGREKMMMPEMAAMFATGGLGITAAFFLAIPGRSRAWAWAPVPSLLIWIALSGMGCWRDLLREGAGGWKLGHSADCLLFILATSLALSVPIVWRLSRARPIEPVRVAIAAGIGITALSAFLLQFFHPFIINFLDLGVHLLAVGAVIAAMTLGGRRVLGDPQTATPHRI